MTTHRSQGQLTLSRRGLIQAAGSGLALSSIGLLGSAGRAMGATALVGDSPILKPLPPQWFTDFGTNAEMRWDSIRGLGYFTRNRRLFVRDHTSTPLIGPSTYRLNLYGDGLAGGPTADNPISFSYRQLKQLEQKTVNSFVECTGNGRSFFGSQQGQTVSGTAWTLGAIGVTRWTGVPLSALLDRAGLLDSAIDVMATGLDDPYVSGDVDYGHVRRPIPIEKALDDTLVALEMNGSPLLPDHGFPARLIAPGWVGIANIKWLGSLEVSASKLTSPWNTKWYRMTGGDYPVDAPPLTTMPVKSAFELPWSATLPARRRTRLVGRSWSGEGAIARVDVSTDGGSTWQRARLHHRNLPHAWTQWHVDWTPPGTGTYELLARATDTTGRTQPDTVPFNTNGYLFWAVVRHPVIAVGP